MRRAVFIIGALAGGLCGCQCCALTEPVGDVADAISVHEIHADGLYCPGLDLTRIGRRDWCQYPINHWLCPCRCEQQCSPACP